MWPAIIGAAISAAASIAGGAISSAAARKAKATQEERERQRQAENQAWYDRRYNEDPLQRASAQRVLTKTAEMIRERNRAAQGRAAVMGGTEESVAATKAANAKAMADAASTIAASADARKDQIESAYRNADAASKDRMAEIEANYQTARGNAVAQAVQGVGSAAASIASAVGGDSKNSSIDTSPTGKAN